MAICPRRSTAVDTSARRCAMALEIFQHRLSASALELARGQLYVNTTQYNIDVYNMFIYFIIGSSIDLLIHSLLYLLTHVFIFIYSFMYVTIYLSIYLSAYLPTYLSIYLSIYLFIYHI